MDNKQEILLGNQKNINSVNTDNYTKIELTRNVSEITEFTVNDVVNSTLVFDAERKANQNYRIYGRIEWMSLLNGVTNSTSRELEDFFNPTYSENSKNIIDSFDFYLVAPSSGETYGTVNNTNYRRRNFEVIATPNDFEIYKAGFSNNVYGEQVYAFNFKTDFDVSEYYDNLGFPLTELFLYAQYKIVETEEMSWSSFTITGDKNKVDLTTKDLNIGDIVENHQNNNIQDLIEYSAETYFQEQIDPQIFYIRTRYFDGVNKWLEWSYNPFIPFRLRYLDGVVSTAPLPKIIEDTSSFSIQVSGMTSTNFTATKLLKQSLITDIRTIDKWNDQSTINYNWDSDNGILSFISSETFEISFQTEISLSQDTDKYIGETYLEESTGSGWVEIPYTKRKYQISSPVQSTTFIRSFNNGDEIRIRTNLIPNPEERKIERIPDYTKMIEANGKYVWRDILSQGYVDPITNLGVDYPFFNKRRYLFEVIVFDVPPNLTTDQLTEHQNTLDVFDEISYYENATTLDITPSDENDLDNIGKPCQ